MPSYTKQPDGTWKEDARYCGGCGKELPVYASDFLCIDCLTRRADG